MNYQFEDQQVACLDCGTSFTFSAEDQEFFAQKGYSEPKRCPACRAARKANSSRSGGGRSGGGSRGGFGGGGERPQYRVTCSACGCDTTVPFEPKGGRPVYCSDCYRNG
ncbi:MAG: CxxC-x17-CxxC domain-containing protein [bacterium]